ncbi:methionyl-tRNA formyltransferase [Candidatus Peregrinibacteria bacterium]|nr:methionyl-tRNA formyltransferase [Candidatus Peregrinibacteria bacterium]
MEKIKIIFAGTPEISTPLLHSLAEDERFDVCLVITQQDKPAGRKMELTAPPAKKTAMELSLDIFQPENINSPDSAEIIKSKECDIMLVIAYGQIFKEEVLNAPKKGCLNVHASLLPKYRGASPIQCAIGNRENKTGISLMEMSAKMDAGDVYSQFEIQIEDDDNAITLESKLAHLSAHRIPDALYSVLKEGAKPTPQDESKATYCHKIIKSDGLIDWNEEVEKIEARIRSLVGWPGTYTFFNGKNLKIIEARLKLDEIEESPGTVFMYKNDVAIAGKNGVILPSHVQIEGKKIQSINDFINGNPDFINSKLG